jgi:DNA-binding winged helix-turn-helix (wHTH) protein
MAIAFGEFELDDNKRTLKCAGQRIQVNGQVLELLRLLLERPGEVVTREELQRRLWPDRNVIFEHSLDVLLSRLRKVLADDSKSPRYIETVPKQGYRFIEPVVIVATVPEVKRRRIWLRKIAAYAAVAVLAGITSVVIAHNRYPDRTPSSTPQTSSPQTLR